MPRNRTRRSARRRGGSRRYSRCCFRHRRLKNRNCRYWAGGPSWREKPDPDHAVSGSMSTGIVISDDKESHVGMIHFQNVCRARAFVGALMSATHHMPEAVGSSSTDGFTVGIRGGLIGVQLAGSAHPPWPRCRGSSFGKRRFLPAVVSAVNAKRTKALVLRQ